MAWAPHLRQLLLRALFGSRVLKRCSEVKCCPRPLVAPCVGRVSACACARVAASRRREAKQAAVDLTAEPSAMAAAAEKRQRVEIIDLT